MYVKKHSRIYPIELSNRSKVDKCGQLRDVSSEISFILLLARKIVSNHSPMSDMFFIYLLHLSMVLVSLSFNIFQAIFFTRLCILRIESRSNNNEWFDFIHYVISLVKYFLQTPLSI
ncbi:hypothetical protein V8G54_019906 [Vigna mungo]|uniref:Uncharacterized protein n=1 Tax=Vigna mungo TaxID=3915 RepID=A0AAQ3NBC3_VIGMU